MTVSARVLYASVFRMGSVVFSIVEETAADAREIYSECVSTWDVISSGKCCTARMSSLSSIVRSASDTASPTFTPALWSSSAAALSFGFSLILEIN